MKLLAGTLLFSFSIIVGNASAQNSQSVNSAGKMLYQQTCLPCHQADGSGVPGLAPPLVKGVFVNGEIKRLVTILVEGMEGVEINGETYANPMPAFSYLSDEDIANVLTYVRSNFGNKAEAVTLEEVRETRIAK